MIRHAARLVTVATLGLGLAAPSLASTARMAGMNLSPDYVNDATAMFTYLTALTASGSHAYVDAGSVAAGTGQGDRAMGAVLAGLHGGRAGVWAVHMREVNPALGQSWFGFPVNPGYLGFDPNRRDESLDLMWGGRAGSADVAARFQRSFNSAAGRGSVTEGLGPTRRNVTAGGIGIGFDLAGRASVEASGQFQARTFRSATQRDDGGPAYLFAARARSAPRPNLQCVPVVKFYRIDLPWVTSGSPVRNEVNLSGWQVGGAANWATGGGDLLVAGLRFAANTLHVGSARATESLSPTVFLAFETPVNAWLTLRAGARSTSRLVFEQAGGPATSRLAGSAFSLSTGASVKMGRLAVDAALDPGFFNSPLAQLLGSEAAAFEGRGTPGNGTRHDRASGAGPGVAFPLVSLGYAW